MWKKYIPNAKVSYLEYDAACATKHKTDIEAQAGGTLYIGNTSPRVQYNRLAEIKHVISISQPTSCKAVSHKLSQKALM